MGDVIRPEGNTALDMSRIMLNMSVDGVGRVIPPRTNSRVEGLNDVIHPGRTFPVEGARGSSGPDPIIIDEHEDDLAINDDPNNLSDREIRKIHLHL